MIMNCSKGQVPPTLTTTPFTLLELIVVLFGLSVIVWLVAAAGETVAAVCAPRELPCGARTRFEHDSG